MIRLLIITILTFTLSKPGIPQVRKPSKPNIIYIMADDAGYGDFGCYGQRQISTPNIDKMAQEGMLFTQHYAGAPVCAPSRCSLLTGIHTGHSYIRGNRERLPEGQMALKKGIPTIADILATKNYTSAVIGKWGLGGPETEGVPSEHGFDHFFGYLCQREAHEYYPDHVWRNANKVQLDGKKYIHDLFTSEALKYIDSHREKPFFLYLAYTIPHAKLQVPDLGEYAERDWPLNKKKYAAMISRLDRDVGSILEKLKTSGLSKKTIIIFTSDNGPHSEGGYNPDYFNSNGPLRGIKRDLYEGGIRVPMIAWWPGKIPADTISSHVSAFWDIMPTLAEITGAALPKKIDGMSMLSELLGKSSTQKDHEYLYWEFHEQGGKQALRKNDWKAIRLNVRLFPNAEPQLYNLGKDPGETTDLADEYPEMTAEIKKLMTSARTESEEFPLIGKMVYAFGLFNSWLMAAVYGIVSVLLFMGARKGNRSDLLSVYITGGKKAKLILLLRSLSVISLFAITLISPLWFGTVWMDIGIVVSIVGLIGFTLSYGSRVFRNPDSPPVNGVFRINKMADTIFSCIFWTGVAIVSVSWILILFTFLFYVAAKLSSKIKTDYYLIKHGDEYVFSLAD